jgi:hypothetical protein
MVRQIYIYSFPIEHAERIASLGSRRIF